MEVEIRLLVLRSVWYRMFGRCGGGGWRCGRCGCVVVVVVGGGGGKSKIGFGGVCVFRAGDGVFFSDSFSVLASIDVLLSKVVVVSIGEEEDLVMGLLFDFFRRCRRFWFCLIVVAAVAAAVTFSDDDDCMSSLLESYSSLLLAGVIVAVFDVDDVVWSGVCASINIIIIIINIGINTNLNLISNKIINFSIINISIIIDINNIIINISSSRKSISSIIFR